MTPKLYGTAANSNFMLPMFGSPTALSAEQLKSMITRRAGLRTAVTVVGVHGTLVRGLKLSPAQLLGWRNPRHAAAANHVCQQSDTDATQRTTRLGCDTMGPAMWMT